MLFDQNPALIQCSDKYRVREFVKERIGGKYLIKLIGSYERFSDIDFSRLPVSFVIKTNHDSGSVYLIKNRNESDQKALSKKLSKALPKKYGVEKGEWNYQYIRPKIIIEEYLGALADSPPPDFKFHCVNGRVAWLQYIYDRESKTKEIIFDRNFNQLPLHLDLNFQSSNLEITKPLNWNKMVAVAEKLATNFKYVRIDLYNTKNRILFGEMTFFPMSGCYSSYDIKNFGEMMNFDTATFSPPLGSNKAQGTK